MLIENKKKSQKLTIFTILIVSLLINNQKIFARERNEIFVLNENNNLLNPPFFDCRSMQSYFNKKYDLENKKTTFSNFQNQSLISSKIDYSSRSIERGLYALKNTVLTCGGGNIVVRMKTPRGVEFEKICPKSKIYYYTLSNGKTILSWSDIRIIYSIFDGRWKIMGYLNNLMNEGECYFNI